MAKRSELDAMTGNLLASGIGVIVPQLQEHYDHSPRVSDLVTYPALFMGIGNLIAVPVADAVGRRPVYLASNVVLIAGGIWCACSDSLSSHIGGRDFMALAAGQSEALCVMIAEVCIGCLFYMSVLKLILGWEIGNLLPARTGQLYWVVLFAADTGHCSVHHCDLLHD